MLRASQLLVVYYRKPPVLISATRSALPNLRALVLIGTRIKLIVGYTREF